MNKEKIILQYSLNYFLILHQSLKYINEIEIC